MEISDSLSASCINPVSPSGVIKEVHPKGIERSSYDHGSRAVFKCDGANGGYGYVTLKCMTDDTWSSRDRDCSG